MIDKVQYEPCGCGNPKCDLVVCTVCKLSDCKWPGECLGKCHWCGGPNPNAFPTDSKTPPSLCCSTKCVEESWAHYEALGQVVNFSDLTQEQVNEELNKIGLGLEGVGPRKLS